MGEEVQGGTMTTMQVSNPSSFIEGQTYEIWSAWDSAMIPSWARGNKRRKIKRNILRAILRMGYVPDYSRPVFRVVSVSYPEHSTITIEGT